MKNFWLLQLLVLKNSFRFVLLFSFFDFSFFLHFNLLSKATLFTSFPCPNHLSLFPSHLVEFLYLRSFLFPQLFHFFYESSPLHLIFYFKLNYLPDTQAFDFSPNYFRAFRKTRTTQLSSSVFAHFFASLAPLSNSD
jgi:hypothetical protein